MADYHSPTIVRPDIPRAAMTLLEHRLLIGMFSHEGGEDEVYFFAEEYVNDLLHLDLAEVHQLLEVDPFPDSYAVTVIRDHLRKLDPAEGELALDMSGSATRASSRTSSNAAMRSTMSRSSLPGPAPRCGPTASAGWRR